MLEAILNEEQMGIFGFGNKKDDNEDEGISRREALKTLGKGALVTGLAGTGFLKTDEAQARAKSFPVIPEAAYKIWQNYPGMQYVLDLLNMEEYENANYVPLIEFIMFPNKVGYGKKLFTMNNVEKIKGAEFNTPQYWLLLRIADPRGLYDSLFGEKYNTIPQPPKNSGVWHFAKGLLKKNPNREQDLLKALYIGATGDDSNVNDIVNGNFTRRSEVDKQIAEWKIQFPNWEIPFSPLGDKKYAYLITTLKTDQARDKELVALAIMALGDNAKDQESKNIYYRVYNSYLNQFKAMPKYVILNKQGGWASPYPKLF